MEYAMDVQNLVMSYPRFTLKNVSFKLPCGYIMGFIGENGAGKTTTIKAVINLIRRQSGDVKILGKGIDEAMKDIAVVLGDSSFPDGLTPKDMNFILRNAYPKWNSNTYSMYLEMFNLDPSKNIGTLSKGNKVKVMIAAALSHEARLLVMDEPTSGLDPVFRSEILDVLHEYVQNDENSVFFSSHIVSDLEKISDYVTMIHDGEILFSMKLDDLMNRYRIVTLSKKEMANVNRKKLIGLRKTEFGSKALVLNGDFNADKYALDTPTLEQIMLYNIKNEEKQR
jgi:ABC-2 type transport system ATP-binding protein